MNLDIAKRNQLGESLPNIYFAMVNLYQFVLEGELMVNLYQFVLEGELMVNLKPNSFDEKVNRSEGLKRVSSRCHLTAAFNDLVSCILSCSIQKNKTKQTKKNPC